MKTWLASFQVERGGECFDVHFLLQAESEIMAEAGCGYMGQAWWPGGALESEGCYWRYRCGDVWLKLVCHSAMRKPRCLTRRVFWIRGP
ncbi:hypothetical protein [Pantoea piersonii]|uniref:hypothetical protein n=1 Tax=Pantoea TaxID=53335 RepID=UPI0028A84126|nr:hypothetical protein [Pantoea piersonii]